MATTRQALLELKRLAASAADNLYRRIELSAQVMSDLDWIAREHGGSDLKAQDTLQDQFFRDLGGFISLGKLIAMFRNVPQETWAELKYDVAAVEVVYDDQAIEKTEKGTKTAWKPIAEERGEKIERLQRQMSQVNELADKQRSEIDVLRAKVEELTRENERLRGRVEELQRLLDRQVVQV